MRFNRPRRLQPAVVQTILTYSISMLLTNQHMASEMPTIIGIRGNEKVLDVGCGLGKMTIGIAKVLTEGKVIGIDIWDKMEIPGNSPERAYENAKIEGVKDKVEFKYGNILDIPFTNNSFDLVTAGTSTKPTRLFNIHSLSLLDTFNQGQVDETSQKSEIQKHKIYL